MKTDAEFLTEHALLEHRCPCDPAPRRAKKKVVKDGGKHKHGSLKEICDCLSLHLTDFLRRELPHFPSDKLAEAIIRIKKLPHEKLLDDFLARRTFGAWADVELTAVVFHIVERKELYRCETLKELNASADLVTPTILDEHADWQIKAQRAADRAHKEANKASMLAVFVKKQIKNLS